MVKAEPGSAVKDEVIKDELRQSEQSTKIESKIEPIGK